MQTLSTIIMYMLSHPGIMTITIILSTIVLSPITWMLLKLFLYVYHNHIRTWKENWLVRKEYSKEFYKHAYTNWKESSWPHIDDPVLRRRLKDKGITDAHELHIGTKIVITMGKNGAVPIEYVYCWGLEIQDKASYKTLSKCWKLCYSNPDRVINSMVIYNSYLNMGIHYLDGIGVKKNYRKALKYFTKYVLSGGDPDDAVNTLNEALPISVLWDPYKKELVKYV